jgi:alpha-beta hydrolase superfamily lysophospholipase
MQVFYLHGFASSAASTKASYFAAKLRGHGVPLQTPDLNQPDFSTLTVSRMVGQLTEAIDRIPSRSDVALIGSSLGGLVAVHVARQRPDRVARLILLAPALEFGGTTPLSLGDRDLDGWKSSGVTNVFHYGYGRMLPVGYQLYADACRYDCSDVILSIPIQIFQGCNDTVVDPASVERWTGSRPNVEFHMLEDDHQLGRSLDHIWTQVVRFLGL